MDANEDIYKKNPGKSITARYGLNTNEVVGTFTGKKIGATFFRGSKLIDAAWVTPDIVVVGACVIPEGYGVSDHSLFVLDFLTYSLIGQTPPQIIRLGARRLNTKKSLNKDKHINLM